PLTVSSMSAIPCLLDCPAPGAGHYRRTDTPAVLGGRVLVRRHGVEAGHGGLPDVLGREVGGMPGQLGFPASGSAHGRPEPEQPDATPANAVVAVQFDSDGGAGEREVPVTAGELLHREPASPVPHGKGDAGEDLVGGEGGAPHAREEPFRRDGPAA